MRAHQTRGGPNNGRLFSLLILLIALSGCTKPPQTSDIAGTWEIVKTGMSGTLALRPDAGFVADTDSGKLEGTWKIEDDRLVGTVSKSTVPNISMGYSWVSEITHLSKTELTLKGESGATESYRRVE